MNLIGIKIQQKILSNFEKFLFVKERVLETFYRISVLQVNLSSCYNHHSVKSLLIKVSSVAFVDKLIEVQFVGIPPRSYAHCLSDCVVTLLIRRSILMGPPSVISLLAFSVIRNPKSSAIAA